MRPGNLLTTAKLSALGAVWLLVGCVGKDLEIGEAAGVGGQSELVVLKANFGVELHDGNIPVVDFSLPNRLEKALCLPMYRMPTSGWPANDRYSVFDLTTGRPVETVSDRLHVPGIVSEVDVLTPGAEAGFTERLSPGFAFVSGHEYRVTFQFSAYYCSAFDDGYPDPGHPYLDEVTVITGSQFFPINADTTVLVEGEIEFLVD